MHKRYYSGVVYDLEVAQDHSFIAGGVVVHNCTSITVLKGRPAPAVESGPDWFARQSEDRQRAMMGGARFEAWKAGAIQWGDMSRVYDDPVFGRMVGEASLKGMLGDGAKEYYKR